MMKLLAVMVASAAMAGATADDGAQDEVKRLAWLSGCWELRSGSRLVEEQWMAPRAGLMLGISRTTRNDSVIEFEQVRIETRPAGVFYVALPSRQAMAEFRASSIGDSSATFENPAHDFPQRIMYRLASPDTMVASVEGPRGGQTRTISFPYGRVACR